MKKKIILILSIFAGVCVLVFSFINSNSAHTEPSLTKEKVKELVQEQYPGKVDDPVLRTENKEPIYNVKVTNDDKAYQLKLNGNSGEVLDLTKEAIKNDNLVDKKKEAEQASKNNEPTKKAETENKTESKTVAKSQDKKKKVDPLKKEKKTVISEEEVKKIALQQFSGVIEDIDLDEENGRLIYEVEIENGDREAEVEIDAYSGEVILIEIDED